MILHELKDGLNPLEKTFFDKAEIVYLEIFTDRYLKLKDGNSHVDETIYDYDHIKDEFEDRRNVFIRYRNDTSDYNY